MKACNTDMYHFLKVLAGIGEDFSVLSGEDVLFPLQMAAGAKGGIIVTATLLPKTWKAMYEAGRAGRHAEAIAMHRKLLPLIDMSFARDQPGAVEIRLGPDRGRCAARPGTADPGRSNPEPKTSRRTLRAVEGRGDAGLRPPVRADQYTASIPRRPWPNWTATCGQSFAVDGQRVLTDTIATPECREPRAPGT